MLDILKYIFPIFLLLIYLVIFMNKPQKLSDFILNYNSESKNKSEKKEKDQSSSSSFYKGKMFTTLFLLASAYLSACFIFKDNGSIFLGITIFCSLFLILILLRRFVSFEEIILSAARNTSIYFKRICLLCGLECIYSMTLLFFGNQVEIWFFHLIGAILVMGTLCQLSNCIYRDVINTILGKISYSSLAIFSLALSIVIIQIFFFAFFMYHSVIVTYKFNASNETDYHLLEFCDNTQYPNDTVIIGVSTSPVSSNVSPSNQLSFSNSMDLLTKCLYFATTTFTSVGYGDIVPHTNWAKVFSIIVSLFGYIMAAIIIGIIIGGVVGKREESP